MRMLMHWLKTATRLWLTGCLAVLAGALPARAEKRVVLKNGFALVCNHTRKVGDRVQLFLGPGGKNFIEVNANEIKAEGPAPATPRATAKTGSGTRTAKTPQSVHRALVEAGKKHDLDVALLESVIEVESGGNPDAVSPKGARGLMQLMPATAAKLGVTNSFAGAENVRGGTAYLDSLLDRYHNNLALALAAYNAGPAAVDKWHGIPPYPETRRYVARVIHDYNLRYEAKLRARKASRAAEANK